MMCRRRTARWTHLSGSGRTSGRPGRPGPGRGAVPAEKAAAAGEIRSARRSSTAAGTSDGEAGSRRVGPDVEDGEPAGVAQRGTTSSGSASVEDHHSDATREQAFQTRLPSCWIGGTSGGEKLAAATDAADDVLHGPLPVGLVTKDSRQVAMKPGIRLPLADQEHRFLHQSTQPAVADPTRRGSPRPDGSIIGRSRPRAIVTTVPRPGAGPRAGRNRCLGSVWDAYGVRLAPKRRTRRGAVAQEDQQDPEVVAVSLRARRLRGRPA